MNISRLLSRIPVALGLGLALLIGCQTSPTDPQTPPSTALTAKGTVEFQNVLRLPEQGVWRTSNATRGADTGRGAITCVLKSNGKYDCSQEFALKAVLGTDRLRQDLYALGVHFGTLTYMQTGSQPQLTHLSDSNQTFAMEAELVRSFNAAFKVTHTAQQVAKPGDLVAYYAELLLNGDTLVKNKTIPKGMVADSVQKAVVVLAAKLQLTAKALAEKALVGLTPELIRGFVAILAKESGIDTTIFYPQRPVRVTEPVRVLGDLIEGEGSVAVTGAFAWDNKYAIRKTLVQIRTAQGADEKIVHLFKSLPDPSSGSWILTGNLTLQAQMGASIGIDTLIVLVKGDSGADTSRAIFRVRRGDSVPPVLDIVSPSSDTTVSNETESIALRLVASDNKALTSVKIGNKTLSSSPYFDTVDLAVGRNILIAQASDAAGFTTYDTVIVQREKSTTNTDATEPVVSLRSPSQDTSVVTGLPSLDLSWNATDNVGVKKVTLNDAEITGTAGAYSKSVALHDGPNVFEIKAFDDAGNVGKKSVTITRPADQSKPGITPPSDQTVASDVTTFKLTWKITNSQKAAKIALNGSEVTLGAEVTSEVSLKPGANTFNLVVTDLSGATISETVVITRTVDVVLPSITALTDRSVGADIDTDTLVWAITNADQAKSGTVNSDPITVGASITKQVKLDPGPNVFKLTLKDAAGTTVSSSVTITRAIDTTVLGIAKLADASVGVDDSTTTLTWTILHNNKAVSADINGAVAVVGPTISKMVSLVPGPNTFKLTLTDSKGATVSSSVTITRAIDTDLLGVVKLSDRSVNPETEKDTLTWTILNSAKAVSAKLNDKPVTAGATIREIVSLVAGDNTFILTLKDAKGNTVADTVVVARAADATGPSVVWVAPTKKTEVEATVTTFAAQVKVTDASGVESVTLNGVVTKKETGDLYSISLALPKPDGNPIWIVVVAKDAKGNTTKDSLSVTRKAPDGTNKPIIKLVKPALATGNALPFETTKLHVEADITDALLAIDAKSVTIGGVAATATGSVYAADVPVLATGKPTMITIKAANANGIAATLDIEVTRAKDGIKPDITSDATTKTQSVEYGTTTFALSWTVTDNVGVASLIYNGLPEKAIAKTITKTLSLVEGDNKATLIATDSAGNADTSVVVITRKKDAIPPVVKFTKPSKDTTVAYGTTSIEVTATATDAGSGVLSLKIGATDLTATGKAMVSLVPGKNEIKVIAMDNAKNSDTAIVTVTVASDATKPDVKITTPKATDPALAWGKTSVSVTATATDVGGTGIDYVMIGETKVTVAPYTAVVNGLKAGANTITVTAFDKQKNSASATVVVTVTDDQTDPVLDITTPADKSEIAYPYTVVDVTAKATDAVSGLKSITIKGATSGSCTTSPCTIKNVAPDAAGKITVVATDNATNTTEKSITVTIGADKSKPVISWAGATSKEVVVTSSSPSYTATWTVTDNDLATVTIDKVGATGAASNTFSKAVTITGDKQLISIEAKDKSGNSSTDQLTARLVKAPTMTPAGGSFSAPTSVTLSAPLGSIEYQMGTGAWLAYNGPISVTTTSSIKSRATYGGKTEATAAMNFTITYDASIASVTVDGVKLAANSVGFYEANMASFATTARIVVEASDKTNAKITFDGDAITTGATSATGSGVVNITVSNGGLQKIYNLVLNLKNPSRFTDSRNRYEYDAKYYGGNWWMTRDLEWAGLGIWYQNPDGMDLLAGRLYNWTEAKAACPDGWRLPSSADWQALVDLAGGDGTAGGWLKSVAYGGTNLLGLGIELTGDCHTETDLVCTGWETGTIQWTSSTTPTGLPLARSFDLSRNGAYQAPNSDGGDNTKSYAHVRCVKK